MNDANFTTVDITISIGTASRVVSVEFARDAWDAATEAQRAEMIHPHVMDFVSWDWTAVN